MADTGVTTIADTSSTVARPSPRHEVRAARSVERVAEDKLPGGPFEMRVILVGRTGLDLRLRLETSVDLVRARTPMDAIGELTQPMSKAPGVPCIVVVGDDQLAHHDAARDFVLAIHDEHAGEVKVAKVAPARNDPAPFDAILPPDAGLAELRTLLNSRQSTPTSSPAPSPITSPAPVFKQPPPMPPAPAAETDLIRAASNGTGDDVTRLAVAVLRERLREPALALEQTGQGPQVFAGHRPCGMLTGARRATPAELDRAAEWLGSWIRLADVQASLRHAAYTDDLTGAYNRRYFDRFLADAMAEARLRREAVTILLFDIDDFKRYNDAHGHATGDAILRETVRLLRSAIRPTDRVCRIGGDEFAVIFHEPPRELGSKQPTDLAELAQRFQRQISGHTFPILANPAGSVTISGGLATFPWDGATPAELLAHADRLALDAKRQGKNVIRLGN